MKYLHLKYVKSLNYKNLATILHVFIEDNYIFFSGNIDFSHNVWIKQAPKRLMGFLWKPLPGFLMEACAFHARALSILKEENFTLAFICLSWRSFPIFYL